MGVGQPQTERRHGEDLFEQPFAALLGRLGQLAGGDVLVGRDHPPRRRFGKRGDAQVEPALCVRTVAGVVHLEQVALARDDRAQAGLGRGRDGRVLAGRAGAGRKITEAGKDGAGRHAVACGELLPGAVHREDPPLVVEDGDVGREGIHGGAQKLFRAGRLRLGAGPFDGVAADAAEHLGVQPVHDQGVLGAGAQRLQGERFVVPGNEGEHRRGRCGRRELGERVRSGRLRRVEREQDQVERFAADQRGGGFGLFAAHAGAGGLGRGAEPLFEAIQEDRVGRDEQQMENRGHE